MVNKMALPFSFWPQWFFLRKMERTHCNSFETRKRWCQLECLLWKHFEDLHFKSYIFWPTPWESYISHRNIMKSSSGIAGTVNHFYRGMKLGRVLLGDFGDLSYRVSTKCYWNVCQAWQGGLIQRHRTEHFWSAEITFGALGHIKSTK